LEDLIALDQKADLIFIELFESSFVQLERNFFQFVKKKA